MEEIITITKLRGRYCPSGTEGAKMEKATWKNTFYPHGWVGHISIHHANARALKYPYFMWNGEVYHTADGVRTGETIDDLNCTNDIAILDRVDSVLASAQEVVRKVEDEKENLRLQLAEAKHVLGLCVEVMDMGKFPLPSLALAASIQNRARSLAN